MPGTNQRATIQLPIKENTMLESTSNNSSFKIPTMCLTGLFESVNRWKKRIYKGIKEMLS